MLFCARTLNEPRLQPIFPSELLYSGNGVGIQVWYILVRKNIQNHTILNQNYSPIPSSADAWMFLLILNVVLKVVVSSKWGKTLFFQ